MLALEIHVNDSEHFTVSADNLVFVSLSYGVSKFDRDYASIRGTDDSYHYVWADIAIQKGDKILVRIVDVDKDKISSPQMAKMKDRRIIRQEFERLKLELQKRQMV